MSSLIKKLVELARFAAGISPPASCSFCGVSYAKAKPFVEGVTGALICRPCLTIANDQAIAQSSVSGETGGHAEADQEAGPNPYQPPTAPANQHGSCSFCGVQEATGEYSSKSGETICQTCISKSLHLIDAELSK